MTDLAELYDRAAGRFSDRVAGIPADGWDRPTPCADWDVRALVNHVTYEQLWAPHLVAGETIAQVGDRYEGDVLGADPAGSWGEAVAGAVAAFHGADLDATVHLSYADVPLREYLVQMLTDAEVHGWDLATATGQDPSLDREAASLLLAEWSAQRDLVRASGMFGEEVVVADDGDDATQLLGLLGRRA